jgi:FkbM family methyltransferase
MLITIEEVQKALIIYNIKVNGVLHLGAHNCEEISAYKRLGLTENDVIWIDALPHKVNEAKSRGIPNVYNAVITDKDDETVLFNVTNNMASSSVLDLYTHLAEHPHVHLIGQIQVKTQTLNTFFEKNQIDTSKLNFWNFDIQGAELLALKGAAAHIHNADVLYLEVNVKELYKNCALMSEIDAFLSDYGFKRIITELTQYGWGDALYIKSKI